MPLYAITTPGRDLDARPLEVEAPDVRGARTIAARLFGVPEASVRVEVARVDDGTTSAMRRVSGERG